MGSIHERAAASIARRIIAQRALKQLFNPQDFSALLLKISKPNLFKAANHSQSMISISTKKMVLAAPIMFESKTMSKSIFS